MTRPVPPTGMALLRALVEADGSLDYRDPRVTIPGLTALRSRGMAHVFAPSEWPGKACVILDDAGRAALDGRE